MIAGRRREGRGEGSLEGEGKENWKDIDGWKGREGKGREMEVGGDKTEREWRRERKYDELVGRQRGV